jgi:cytochrome c553
MRIRSVRFGALRYCLALALLLSGFARAAISDQELAERVGDGDPEAGLPKSQACQGCHGADGNGTGPAPVLAAQYSSYLLKQFRKFQFGERPHPGTPAANTLSSEDLADIAAYFAFQDRTPRAAASEPAGERLFARGDVSRQIAPCTSCHGDKGQGLIAGSDANPAIGGQHAAYLRAQLLDWRSGKRVGSTAMSLVAKALSDAEIEALSVYLAGLH